MPETTIDPKTGNMQLDARALTCKLNVTLNVETELTGSARLELNARLRILENELRTELYAHTNHFFLKRATINRPR